MKSNPKFGEYCALEHSGYTWTIWDTTGPRESWDVIDQEAPETSREALENHYRGQGYTVESWEQAEARVAQLSDADSADDEDCASFKP
ncbi:hypothetical protein [Stenotrophomonas maltophilia]|uniref:hypothetical protein n=1 Tax=Stenotrophomonas maltophilia TaxID=40324 RepID=UPI000B4C84A6|nr:hypothetical protein [Stenotrophomonas maltophilia]OWQ61300.1 hypothetical protein CEE58_15840 [Stenotrophomonas maltophilia]